MSKLFLLFFSKRVEGDSCFQAHHLTTTTKNSDNKYTIFILYSFCTVALCKVIHYKSLQIHGCIYLNIKSHKYRKTRIFKYMQPWMRFKSYGKGHELWFAPAVLFVWLQKTWAVWIDLSTVKVFIVVMCCMKDILGGKKMR